MNDAVALPRLEEWRLKFVGGSARLTGRAHGHPSPDVDEGEVVMTSQVQSIDFINNTAQTRNTLYQLGQRAD
jgi:hypothetical protein